MYDAVQEVCKMAHDAEAEAIEAAARRAGANLWKWEGLSFEIVENTFPLSDLDPLVQTLQPEFYAVNIRRRIAGPMAGGLWGEAALMVAFSAVAIPFLAELGKDLYRGFRAALFAAYGKARTWANGRGYYPLAVEINQESGPTIIFIFPSGLDDERFEKAFLVIQGLYRDLEGRPDYPDVPVVMRFDADSGTWNRRDDL